LYIGDFNKDEALAYLVKNRKIDAQIAKRIYDLSGGRISHIIGVALEIDRFLNKWKNLGKNADYDDKEFRKEVIKIVNGKLLGLFIML